MFFFFILTAFGTNQSMSAGMQQALKICCSTTLAYVSLIKEPLLYAPSLLSGLVVYCPFQELFSLEMRQITVFLVLSPANLCKNYRFKTHLT